MNRLGAFVAGGALVLVAIRAKTVKDDALLHKIGVGEHRGDELPWQARRYLSGAWARYKRMLSAGRDAAESVEEWEKIRRDGKEAAAEINEIRRAYGQPPIDFEGVETTADLAAVEGEIFPEDIGHDFDWKPYDPTEDGGKLW